MDAVGFAGEQRFVDIDLAGADHRAIQQDLVARLHHQQIADHQLRRVDLHILPVAHHPRGRAVEQGNPVEPPFGNRLLHDADGSVDDRQTGGHEGVLRLSKQYEQEADPEQGGVDEREEVVFDDLPVGAAGFVLDVVAQPLRAACLHLRAGQPKRVARGIWKQLNRKGIGGHGHSSSV